MALSFLYSTTQRLLGLFNSVRTLYSMMNGDQSIWVHLPDVVLIEIYKYLSDADKLAMSLVCINWRRQFSTPCLWRTRHYDMCGHRSLATGQKASLFADQLGQYLQYLSISCSHPSVHTCKSFQRAIEELLGKLVNAQTQLLEFELERLELERFWKYDTPKEKLISSFSKFFRTQRRLQSFDMSCGQFPVSGGCRILEALGQHAGSTVTDLLIEDFFHSRVNVHQVKRYRKTMSKFTALKYVGLNYNCLSDEIINSFSKNLKGLELINVKVYRNDPHFHRISGNAWKNLQAASPGMRVSFWFESIGHSSDIIPILMREAPVKDIHLWTGYDDDAEWRLWETLEHIAASYSGTLEYLSLELDNTHELVDDALVRLARRCKILKDMTVNAVVLIRTVEEICELQREKKIKLDMLHITCCGLTDVEWAELMFMRDRYKSMIDERKLDFRFTTDLLIDPAF